jgi:hypothetical protein
MLKFRARREEAEARRAVGLLADVRRSVEALGDEDLLDLADIFDRTPEAVLSVIATAEMRRRNLSL